jgi:hypothetical protein
VVKLTANTFVIFLFRLLGNCFWGESLQEPVAGPEAGKVGGMDEVGHALEEADLFVGCAHLMCPHSSPYPTRQKRCGWEVWDWNDRCSLGPAWPAVFSEANTS